MSCLPKPVLRGYVKRKGIKAIVGGFTLGIITSATYYFLVALPRKNAEINFAKTYDPEAHYKDLVSWGYLQIENFAKSNNN